jgi:hypothetical protein
MEDLLQVGKHTAGKLIDQERAVRVQYLVGLPENRFPKLRRHGGVWDARQHVIGMVEIEQAQRLVGLGRRPMDDMKPPIREPMAQEADKVGVGFQRDQYRIGSHPPKNLCGERAYTGAILEKHSCPSPVHLGQNVVYQKA